MNKEWLVNEIDSLKNEMNAVVLAHNYQSRDVQGVADYVGDSLGLAQRSSETDADYVVFAGVDFMAETASVLNPDKKVLLPSKEAVCPMAGMLSLREVVEVKDRYPGAAVVMYVNTHAVVRAESDVTCTSSNAVEVISELDCDRVIFGPDMNLGWYVQQKVDKEVIVVPSDGHCYVHNVFNEKELEKLVDRFSGAVVLVHPESSPVIQEKADYLFSTGQMIDFVKKSNETRFIVGTEVGLVDRLSRMFPDKEFIPLSENAVCEEMKFHNLKSIYSSLDKEEFLVEVEDEIAEKVRVSTEKMFELSGE
ncbi:quinolinate synthase NadA [Methanonatronarchaeum sp. AMET-Sl]|uniref:quinolinate synthase NadA n=1 Tax=Methanonatronarchaeum sp. AMET-Sl TaxID=3037654 RepID=UPI00244DE7AF|nr:quinolinate synthase NadA [Methanonatronarchaeum sp. AMET-Sl]WGI17034.1 quinolinate synthase NadA [Methanonatronarchaeum sp. AMET-Sl]